MTCEFLIDCASDQVMHVADPKAHWVYQLWLNKPIFGAMYASGIRSNPTGPSLSCQTSIARCNLTSKIKLHAGSTISKHVHTCPAVFAFCASACRSQLGKQVWFIRYATPCALSAQLKSIGCPLTAKQTHHESHPSGIPSDTVRCEF